MAVHVRFPTNGSLLLLPELSHDTCVIKEIGDLFDVAGMWPQLVSLHAFVSKIAQENNHFLYGVPVVA